MKTSIVMLLVLIVLGWTTNNIAQAEDPHHTPTDGTAGTDGQDGDMGADGQDGQDGAPGPIGPIGLTGAAGPIGPTGAAGMNYHISDDDVIDSIMAASMAAAVIEFSHGTRKVQCGVGGGTYSGQQSFALGCAQLFETENTEFLGVVKGAYVEENDDWAVGVGATWLLGD